MTTQNTHGGSRPGAGRKAGGRVPYLTRLHPDRVEWIKAQAAKKGCADCEIVEEAIDRRRKQRS